MTTNDMAQPVWRHGIPVCSIKNCQCSNGRECTVNGWTCSAEYLCGPAVEGMRDELVKLREQSAVPPTEDPKVFCGKCKLATTCYAIESGKVLCLQCSQLTWAKPPLPRVKLMKVTCGKCGQEVTCYAREDGKIRCLQCSQLTWAKECE